MGLVHVSAAAPLRRRDFRLFWFGQLASQFGDNVLLVAQAWLVLSLTGSPAAMATVTLCSQIPSIGMLLLGGALVDRLPRRQIAILSDWIRGGLLLAMAFLHWAGRLEIAHIYILAAAFGLVSAFARPAFRALLQALTSSEERVAANALVSAGVTVAGIGGPVLGGLLMAAGGAGAAFAADGLSFLLAGLALLFTRAEEPARIAGRAVLSLQALFGDLAEALRLLAGRRFLLVGIGAMALIVVTGQAPVVLLRPWLAEQAGGGVSTLSVSYTAFAAGMLLTVTALGSLRVSRNRGQWIYMGMLAAGLAQVGIAHVSAPWHLWALDFILGAAVMIYGVLWPVMLQDHVPPEAMGRVTAIDTFGTVVLYPVGIALVGLLSSRPDGPFWTMLGGGALTVLVASAVLMIPAMRSAQ